MSRKCTGTDYDVEHCQVEKMGCEGCEHWKEETEDEQKISKYSKNKSN